MFYIFKRNAFKQKFCNCTFIYLLLFFLRQKNIYFEDYRSYCFEFIHCFLFISLSIESVSTRVTTEANLRTLLWTTNSYDSLVRPDDTVNVTIKLYPMSLLDLVSGIWNVPHLTFFFKNKKKITYVSTTLSKKKYKSILS